MLYVNNSWWSDRHNIANIELDTAGEVFASQPATYRRQSNSEKRKFIEEEDNDEAGHRILVELVGVCWLERHDRHDGMPYAHQARDNDVCE